MADEKTPSQFSPAIQEFMESCLDLSAEYSMEYIEPYCITPISKSLATLASNMMDKDLFDIYHTLKQILIYSVLLDIKAHLDIGKTLPYRDTISNILIEKYHFEEQNIKFTNSLLMRKTAQNLEYGFIVNVNFIKQYVICYSHITYPSSYVLSKIKKSYIIPVFHVRELRNFILEFDEPIIWKGMFVHDAKDNPSFYKDMRGIVRFDKLLTDLCYSNKLVNPEYNISRHLLAYLEEWDVEEGGVAYEKAKQSFESNKNLLSEK